MEESLVISNFFAAASVDYEKAADILSVVSTVLFVLAVLFLAGAVFTFIAFKIPDVIGDLSGRNARKSIADIRKRNEEGRAKSYRPHPIAAERGTITEPVGEKKQDTKKPARRMEETQRGGDYVSNTDKLYYGAQPAADLSEPTEVLEKTSAFSPKTEMLQGATSVLTGGTEVLSRNEIAEALNKKRVNYTMLQSIVLIHTEETI